MLFQMLSDGTLPKDRRFAHDLARRLGRACLTSRDDNDDDSDPPAMIPMRVDDHRVSVIFLIPVCSRLRLLRESRSSTAGERLPQPTVPGHSARPRTRTCRSSWQACSRASSTGYRNGWLTRDKPRNPHQARHDLPPTRKPREETGEVRASPPQRAVGFFGAQANQ